MEEVKTLNLISYITENMYHLHIITYHPIVFMNYSHKNIKYTASLLELRYDCALLFSL